MPMDPLAQKQCRVPTACSCERALVTVEALAVSNARMDYALPAAYEVASRYTGTSPSAKCVRKGRPACSSVSRWVVDMIAIRCRARLAVSSGPQPVVTQRRCTSAVLGLAVGKHVTPLEKKRCYFGAESKAR